MGTHASISRDAWALVVAELIDREAKGKKLPFARLIGRDARTIDRWLKGEVAVSEESVREIARKLQLQPLDLLVKVGYYQAGDLARPEPPDPREDPVIQQIMADPRWSDDERAELVQEQIDRIEADLKRRKEEYDRLVRLRPGQRDAS